MTNKTAGRNDPCPCGSGKKYKQCCLLKQQKKPSLAGRKFSAKVISGGGVHKVVAPENTAAAQQQAIIDYNTLMERSFGSAIHSDDKGPPIPQNPSEYITKDEG